MYDVSNFSTFLLTLVILFIYLKFFIYSFIFDCTGSSLEDNVQWKQGQTLFSWAPKSLQMVIATMKLKDTCSLEEKL